MPEGTESTFQLNIFIRRFVGKTRRILATPRFFFKSLMPQSGFRPSFHYLLTCLLIHALLAGIVHRSPGLVGKNLLMGIAFPFITAGIIHLILTRLLRVKGHYTTAFQVNAHAAAVNLFSWIPILGLLLELYRVYLITIGLSTAYPTTGSRAFLAVVMTIAVYIIAANAVIRLTGGVSLIG